MAQITLRSLAAATGPTGGSTGISFTSQGTPLSVETVDYNFLNLNYQKLDKNLNLSDVQSAQTSRTNLGLGTLAVYNAGGATGLGNIGATGLTTLTSGSTGALVVSGGVGVGGNLTVTGTITGNLTGNVTGSASTLSIPRTLWGQNFNGSANVTGNISSAGNIGATGTLTVDDSVVFNKTTDSTAYNNGAVVVAGGVGITKSVNVNTNLTVGNVLKCTGATGLYVTQDAIIGGNLNVSTIVANTITGAGFGPTPSITLQYCYLEPFVTGFLDGNSTYKYIIETSNLAADRNIIFPSLTTNDTFVFENHTQSLTNKTLSTGTTIVNAGNVGATGVIQFSSGATGAVVVSGGVGIAKNLTIGNNTTLGAGTTTFAPLTFRSGTNLTTPTPGAVEYDGTVFYATGSTGIGRATIATPIFNSGATGPTLINSSTTNYPIFNAPNDTIYIPIGTYKVDLGFYLTVAATTTSGSISLNIRGGGNAIGTMTWFGNGAIGSTGASTTFRNGATGVNGNIVITPASTSNPRDYNVNGSGILRITTAGTIQPSYQSSANLGATGTLSSDNFILITPLSSSGATIATGAWT